MAEEPHHQLAIEEIIHTLDEEAEPFDAGAYAIEDWVTLAVFWGMALSVFLQFFTRYVLNNSLAWTEEIAINCLIVTVFLGSVMCVRTSRHIRVDFIFRFLPPATGRYIALVADVVTIGFFAYATWLMWRYVAVVGRERMVTIDLPRGIVFYAVLAAFALMFVRSIQIFIADIRRKGSVLDRESGAGPTGV